MSVRPHFKASAIFEPILTFQEFLGLTLEGF